MPSVATASAGIRSFPRAFSASLLEESSRDTIRAANTAAGISGTRNDITEELLTENGYTRTGEK